MPIKMGASEFSIPNEDELIEMFQARLDRMSKTERRRRLSNYRARCDGRHPMQTIEVIEFIALQKKVSVLRAFEILTEGLADGSMLAAGRVGSPDAPLEPIPAHYFRKEH